MAAVAAAEEASVEAEAEEDEDLVEVEVDEEVAEDAEVAADSVEVEVDVVAAVEPSTLVHQRESSPWATMFTPAKTTLCAKLIFRMFPTSTRPFSLKTRSK